MNLRMTAAAWVVLAALLMTVSVYADAPVEGRAGRAEVRFMQGMIDHHQMALDMANDCLENAATEPVRALCEAVIAAQTPEIELMQTWLADWYQIDYAAMSMLSMQMPAQASGGHAGHGSATERYTDPVGMMGMMAGLNRAEGMSYDSAWLEAMIDHHDDAVHMSQRILRLAEHDELITLAENIIAAQTAEIEQMEALLDTLGS